MEIINIKPFKSVLHASTPKPLKGYHPRIPPPLPHPPPTTHCSMSLHVHALLPGGRRQLPLRAGRAATCTCTRMQLDGAACVM